MASGKNDRLSQFDDQSFSWLWFTQVRFKFDAALSSTTFEISDDQKHQIESTPIWVERGCASSLWGPVRMFATPYGTSKVSSI